MIRDRKPTAVEPDGPRGYPIVGNLPDFLRDKLGFLSRCAADYGPVVKLKIGGPTFLLNNAEDIKHVLVINSDNYDKSPRLTSPRGRRLSGEGLLTSLGASHLKQRRMMQPVFHRKSVESFAETITGSTRHVLSRWQNGTKLNIADEMMGLAQQTIIETLFGAGFADRSSGLAAAITTRKQYMERVFFSPFPEFLPSRIGREYRTAIGRIDSTIDQAIHERHGHAAAANDLLSLLIHATYEDGTCMSDKQVRDEARTLLITGYETIGEALAWTWYLVARHQEVADKLFAEVDEVLAGQVPGAEDVGKLPYTAMVLAESMRLYPPTWIFIRMARKDAVLPSGVMVPAGSKLYLCQYVTHRNPLYFPRPEQFDPERFSEAAKKERPQFAYFPFGGGPRLCIGDSFARMEGVLVLASIAQRFKLTLQPGQTIVPEPRMTLRPRNGIMMQVQQRDVWQRDTNGSGQQEA